MNPSLAQLRDIHLPAEPTWWPPAPGWWLLALLVLGLLACLGWRILQILRSRRYRRIAERELQRLAAAVPGPQQPAQINALLKRTAMAAYPDRPTAGLWGDEWVRFLADTGELAQSERKVLRALADQPYRPGTTAANDDLVRVANHWIRRHR